MIKRIVFSVILLMSYVCAFAQAPQAINYQAIARDANGNVLIEKQVSIKLAILRGSATGTMIYEETHTATSGKTGVVNLQIGKGTAVTGTFATIDWSQSPYFIRFGMDVNGGTNYKEVATTQMLSVPYALYAETAGNVKNSSTDYNNRFLVLPEAYSNSDFFIGMNPEYEYNVNIRCKVIYLIDEDLDVQYKFEGLPSGAEIRNYNTIGNKGLVLEIYIGNLPVDGKKYNCKFILSDKYGNTQSFPFTCQGRDIGIIDPGSGFTDEDYLNAKNAMLEQYHSFVMLNQDMDKAFMGISSSQDLEIYKDKTYTPSSPQIEKYWREVYLLIRSANMIIGYLEKEDNLSDFKKNILAQAVIVRSYSHFKLAEWFDGAPLILKVLNTTDEELYSPRSTRKQMLSQIIDDLINSYNSIQLDGTPNITSEETQRILYEAYLLNQSWNDVLDGIEDSQSSLMKFYKKVAQYKTGKIQSITEASLINEFMEQHYQTNNQGNLLLNILEYSAEYFGWDEKEAYKAILPIPLNALTSNLNMTQNPGYY